MQAFRKLKRRLRHWGPVWRYGLNFDASRRYRSALPSLGSVAQELVGSLHKDGIAVSHVEDVFPKGGLFPELQAEVGELVKEYEEEVKRIRKNAANAVSEEADKPYMKFYLGTEPDLDLGSIFTRFALQEELMAIADAYFRMHTHVRYYNVWHNFANEGSLRESQLWHRDREDFLILKVFVYLSDVDPGAGPFSYAPGTHQLGNVRGEPPFELQRGVARSDDAQMAELVPADRWITACGGAGTVVLADTRGYHRGGVARTSDRLLYTCMFTSPACSRHYFKIPTDLVASTEAEARLLG